MTATELKNAIKATSFDRCFVFCGEEDYLKQYYLKELRRTILTDEAFEVFNHFSFEGEKINFAKLYDALSAPPMMSDFKLIEWHLADFNTMKESDVTALLDFCEEKKDYPFSCVVFSVGAERFNLGNLPKNPSELYKQLAPVADIVVFDHSTDSQLSSWINRHFAHDGFSVEGDVCRALLDRCGRDMNVLTLEIDKLCAYVKSNARDSVTERDVEYITCPSPENDAFALSNAILSKNKKAAYDSIIDMKRKKTDPSIVLGSLFKLYGEIITVSEFMRAGLSQSDISKKLRFHEYKTGLYMKYASKTSIQSLERMLSVCRDADILVKSTYTNPYTVLERLIAENI